MKRMQFKDFSIIHFTKCLAGHSEGHVDAYLSQLGPEQLKGTFYLETCQRHIWMASQSSLLKPLLHLSGTEFYQGKDAYLFLLRLAVGLESKILGETDIFGQIKLAWRMAAMGGDPHLIELSACIQKIFEDTKEIRASYLQNLGGSSYGTLVRKTIKNFSSTTQPILIVGAGQIAHSVAPFLGDSELWLWNRSPEKQAVLLKKLEGCTGKRLIQEDEAAAWRTAAHVVVCIPMDAEQDKHRLEWFKQGGVSTRTVIHLGGMRACSSLWGSLPQFYALDDLFSLQSSQTDFRISQVSHAQKACEERATLRSLGMSLSTSHCWEDLTCFA